MAKGATVLTALELAVLSGLTVLRRSKHGVQHEDPVLWIGPGASDDVIATIACRRSLRNKRGVDPSERAVREAVARAGFRYAVAKPALHSVLRRSQDERTRREFRVRSR